MFNRATNLSSQRIRKIKKKQVEALTGFATTLSQDKNKGNIPVIVSLTIPYCTGKTYFLKNSQTKNRKQYISSSLKIHVPILLSEQTVGKLLKSPPKKKHRKIDRCGSTRLCSESLYQRLAVQVSYAWLE